MALPAPGAVDSTYAMDIWHEVPLVPQLTGMSCWAAAAAMIVGWRDCVRSRPEEIARGVGHWGAYEDGLFPESIAALSEQWRLTPVEPDGLSPHAIASMLTAYGPLWVGEASPGLHSIVVVGMFGDMSDTDTYLRVNDPWPVGLGERYAKPYREFLRDFSSASENVGPHIQLMHSGGRNSSSRDSGKSTAADAIAPIDGSASPVYGNPDTGAEDVRGFHRVPREAAIATGNHSDGPFAAFYRWTHLSPQLTDVATRVVELSFEQLGSATDDSLCRMADAALVGDRPTLTVFYAHGQTRCNPLGNDRTLARLQYEARQWLARNVVAGRG